MSGTLTLVRRKTLHMQTKVLQRLRLKEVNNVKNTGRPTCLTMPRLMIFSAVFKYSQLPRRRTLWVFSRSAAKAGVSP